MVSLTCALNEKKPQTLTTFDGFLWGF